MYPEQGWLLEPPVHYPARIHFSYSYLERTSERQIFHILKGLGISVLRVTKDDSRRVYIFHSQGNCFPPAPANESGPDVCLITTLTFRGTVVTVISLDGRIKYRDREEVINVMSRGAEITSMRTDSDESEWGDPPF